MERIQKAKSTSLSQPTDQGTQQRLAKPNKNTKTAIEKATTRTLNRETTPNTQHHHKT
jgi:hypothetical protein